MFFKIFTLFSFLVSFTLMAQDMEELRLLSQQYPDSALLLLKKQYSEALTNDRKEQEAL